MTSEILDKLRKYLEEGYSDKEIAAKFQTYEEVIWRVRCRNRIFRPEECPYCGHRQYEAGSECPNYRCISVWPKKWFEAREKRK